MDWKKGQAHLLEHHRCVIEGEFLHRISESLKGLPLSRINSGIHHRLRHLEARQRLDRFARLVERISDTRLFRRPHAKHDVAHLARVERASRDATGEHHADVHDVVGLLRCGGHETLAGGDHSIDDAHEAHDALVDLVPVVEEEGLDRSVDRTLGTRKAM